MSSDTEEQYLKDLEEAEKLIPEHRRRKKPEPEPVEEEPAAEPTETPEEPEAEAPTPAPTPAPAPTASAPSPAPAPEPFPGFNALPEETRKSIQAKIEEAEASKKRADELDRQYKQLHGKVAPLQSQQAKVMAEHTRALQELQKFKAQQGTAGDADFKRKLAEYAKDFPDEAALIEEANSRALAEAKAAHEYAASLEERLGEIDHRLRINDEIAKVVQVHPDWKQKRQSQEFNTWINGMDDYEKQRIVPLLNSPKAEDAIYVLNQFERDLLWARTIANQNQSTATQQVTPTAPAKKPLPEVDPDPTKRSSPPAITPSRNESSAEEAEYAAAVQLWKQRQQEKRRRIS